MKINYKTAYLELIGHLNEKNVWVYDTQIHGPGMAFDLRKGGTRRLIGIDGKMSYKKRLFVLMHEVGHFFWFSTVKQRLNFRKGIGSEQAANRTAIRLIKTLTGKDRASLHLEYARFYNSMNKGNQRNSFILD